jgi:hypothetical protein
MISQIVGRCHVGDSNLKVIRYFLSCIKRKEWRKLKRETRKETLRLVIEMHRENRELYHSVMTGRF